ncbi:putative sulfate exporter family transporter [Gammaproteobacteria bacterium]|nr:putative sulfate exporter family transporter [Gammaproteobacteria bacterium]
MTNIAFIFFIVIVAIVGNAPLAIFLGIIFSIYFKPDINFISRKVSTIPLQIGIVILGTTINLSFILNINAVYIVWISLFVLFSFFGGLFIGRVLKLNSNMTILLASGAAICGGTAMVAVAPIIKAKPSELIVSLTIVFMLNAIAIVFFPMIATYLQMGNEEFGAFAALAIHDTSSVVGAAIQYSPESVEIASVLKLGRTLWLIPLLFVLNYKFNKSIGSASYPKFIVFFVMAIIFNTIFNFSYETQLMLGVTSKAFLMAGLFCIGTQTTLIDLKSLELRPFALSLSLWILAIPTAYLIINSVSL